MIKECLQKLVKSQDLSQEEMENVFNQIMQGEATPSQIAAFITALAIKGETVDEITGAAKVMRKFAAKIDVQKRIILDTCGTGGSGKHSFNVSTLSALIASAAGITVAKHGNRSATSKCGSADLLEKLGVNISADVKVVEKCIREAGIGFLFAPTFHKAMKHAIGPRREIGIRTIFNILGPLTNPANATHQLMGVFKKELCEPLANVLGNLGIKHAIVVHGDDGLDEVSTTAGTFISEFVNGAVRSYTITPEKYAIKKTTLEALQVIDSEHCRDIALKILEGDSTGPFYDLVILNSAFALYAADAVTNVEDGLKLAKKTLRDKKAKDKLELLKKITNEKHS